MYNDVLKVSIHRCVRLEPMMRKTWHSSTRFSRVVQTRSWSTQRYYTWCSIFVRLHCRERTMDRFRSTFSFFIVRFKACTTQKHTRTLYLMPANRDGHIISSSTALLYHCCCNEGEGHRQRERE